VARAWKAPGSNYRRKHYITPHAVESVRKRINQITLDSFHGDEHFMNSLDYAISQAVARNRFQDIRDKESKFRIVRLSGVFEGNWALIYREEQKEIVKTVLTDIMVERSKETGSWNIEAEGESRGD
jgi:hypothetical protein